MSAEPIRVARVDGEALAPCLSLRRRVFVDEQGVDPALEFDGEDEDALHIAAWHGGVLVGTARLRFLPHGAKAERVAVDRTVRGLGVGRALMRRLEQEARTGGAQRIVLNAQEGALAFYRALGYEVTGAGFEEAGIPHVPMALRLDAPRRRPGGTDSISS